MKRAMEWWTVLHWVLRCALSIGVVATAYLGVAGIVTAWHTSADGSELAIVVGAVFLFLSAMLCWWLWRELRDPG